MAARATMDLRPAPLLTGVQHPTQTGSQPTAAPVLRPQGFGPVSTGSAPGERPARPLRLTSRQGDTAVPGRHDPSAPELLTRRAAGLMP